MFNTPRANMANTSLHLTPLDRETRATITDCP